jgi:hypothetical protein
MVKKTKTLVSKLSPDAAPWTVSNDVFYIDLNEFDIYGWENPRNLQLVESLVEAIEAGDDIPPVLVNPYGDKAYELGCFVDPDDPSNKGGHHRVIAYHKLGKPVKCKLASMESWPSSAERIHIRDIDLEDNMDHYEFVKNIDSRYR